MHNTNFGSSKTASAVAAKVHDPQVERIGSREGAGVVLAKVDGLRVAYVADADDRSIRVIDLESEKEMSRMPVDGAPAMLLLLADGTLVATLRDTNHVVTLEGGGTQRSPLRVEKSVRVATEPIGLALTPDDATVLVTSGWGHALTALDSKSLDARWTVDLPRDPRAVVASDDGKRAFVAHATGPNVSVVDLSAAAAKEISVEGEEDASGGRSPKLFQPRHACQGFALAEAKIPGGRIFAPHTLAFTDSLDDDSGGYGSSPGLEPEVFNVAVLDEDKASVMKNSLAVSTLASADETPCPLPRAAVAGKNGSLYVTCLGSNSLVEYDATVVDPHYAELRKWKLPSGPTSLAIDDENGRAYVFSQFAHSLTTVALDVEGSIEIDSLTLSERAPLDPKLARGRELFHTTDDSRISSDGRGCATCHVDGREDSLVWASPDGKRQTPMLAGRLAKTAPYGWNGNAKDIPAHIAKTFSRLGGTGVKGDDRDALIAYITSMPTPVIDTVSVDPMTIARGQAIFDSPAAGCANCHGDDAKSPDGEQHNVKSWKSGDVKNTFDTPTLEFVAGTAPYFHDGRYATLHDLLVKSDGKMGHTKQLRSEDMAALEAYLRTR
ncbi:MAG: c-type cytochrome [Polyangiaceae bacterium]